MDLHLGIAVSQELPLHQLISKAEMPGPQHAAFAIEGSGYYLMKSRIAGASGAEPLASSGLLAHFPPRVLVMLHAGFGLALAEWYLGAADEDASGAGQSMEHFVELCQRNSQAGYDGIIFEALGFVARTIYPHLVDLIDRRLPAGEYPAYFWHGVGRGIYFAPENGSPFRSAPWKAFDMCLREPPHQLGKRNTIAGLGWALTIINIGQPEIMAAFLRHHAAQLTEDDAFTDGVCSAARMWRQVSPGDSRLNAFPVYQRAYRRSISTELWERFVERPFAQALGDGSPLEGNRGPQEWFRYRAFSAA